MARALFGSLVVLAGCAQISGLGSLEVLDAAPDASTNDASTNDAGMETPPDATTADVPSINSDATVDGALGCTKPGDCSQNQPYCCGTVSTQGNYPQCQIVNVTAKCSGTCSTTTPNQKCTTDTVRLCSTNQDCTEAFYNRCCAFPYGKTTIDICTNIVIADAGGATCQ